MRLYSETATAVRWVSSVVGAFFRVRPWTTSSLVFATTLERLTSLLAFFLPLKVILLAGSDGVPRYFRFFIEPSDKMPWIIGLSAAAVGFYILSVAMEAASKRLAEAGSYEVLQGANEIAVASKQREEAQGYYARFSEVAANGLLVLVAFGVITLINPVLFAVLVGLILSQYAFTATLLRFGNPLNPGPTQRMIRSNLSGYLNIWYSVDFLIAFFVILVPFLIGEGGNLLLSILSILLLRQSLNAFQGGISGIVSLSKNRLKIDPLVFRDRQLQKRERPVTRELRQVFEKRAREKSAKERLILAGMEVDSLASEWRDSVIRGIYTFRLRVRTPDGKSRHLQQQVFPRNQLHLLEHEAYLFNQIPRERLLAPEVHARYSEGPFDSQICDYGTASGCNATKWVQVSRDLMTHFWSIQPSAEIVRAFRTSKPNLEGRLADPYLQRLEVALDGSAEVRAYDAFMERMPYIRKIVAAMPVYICNPAINRNNVIDFGAGEYRVMTWGRWTIEPIGAELLKSLDEKSIPRVLEEVRSARSLSEDELTKHHVELANQCRALEVHIGKLHYKKAISSMRKILKNALLDEC